MTTEATRERTTGRSDGTEEQRLTRGTSQTSMDQTTVCVCVRGKVVSSGAVQLNPGVQQQQQQR